MSSELDPDDDQALRAAANRIARRRTIAGFELMVTSDDLYQVGWIGIVESRSRGDLIWLTHVGAVRIVARRSMIDFLRAFTRPTSTVVVEDAGLMIWDHAMVGRESVDLPIRRTSEELELEAEEALDQACVGLISEERAIVRARFLERRTYPEIGALIGVDGSRVCQRLLPLMPRIRENLEAAA